MRPGTCLALTCALAAAAALLFGAQGAAAERLVVAFDAPRARHVESQLAARGFRILLRGPGFYAVEAPGGKAPASAASAAKEAAHVDQRVASLSAIQGVTGVQLDRARAAGDGNLTVAGAQRAAGGEWADAFLAAPYGPQCGLDVPLGSGPFAEVVPYHLAQVQADSAKLRAAVPSTKGRGVMICIIDSGVDMTHPEFASGPDSMDGCKEEDTVANAGCPYKWDSDTTGHGTHVSGIIAAPRNGQGVVGVIPEGADMYYVRVFNTSGDVNQGQGFIYGSSLILAYTQCEGRLAYLQANQPDKKWRMVINMSVGAPGPLTIEKMFFSEATKRDDMLFVASSGNNGTESGSQWLNYPSAYEGVVSVGAVNCANEVQRWSQKNARVDIVAPGAQILSTYPAAKALATGATQGYFSFGNLSLPAAPSAFFSGLGAFSGPLADCGTGGSPCPKAAGAGCLVQIAGVNATLPDGTVGTVIPTACEVVKYCIDQGARAVVVVPPEMTEYGPFPRDLVTPPTLDCSRGGLTGCPCWTDGLAPLLAAGKMPPVMAVTLDQGDELRRLIKASAGGRTAPSSSNGTASSSSFLSSSSSSSNSSSDGAPQAFIKTIPLAYRKMSGTSMATPVVAGVAARVWAAYPACTSHDIKKALKTTAKDLGPPGWDKDSGNGLVQAEAAFDWLAQQPCGLKSKQDEAAWREQQKRQREEPEQAGQWYQQQPQFLPPAQPQQQSQQQRGQKDKRAQQQQQQSAKGSPAPGGLTADRAPTPPPAAANKTAGPKARRLFLRLRPRFH